MHIIQDNCLFDKKEQYFLCHDTKGRATFLQEEYSMSPMYRYENMHLSDGMTFTDYHGIELPVLQPYAKTTDLEFHSYAEINKLNGTNQAIHFFMPDDRFVPSIWKKLEQSTFRLTKFESLFTPDFSMYYNRPSFYAFEATFRKLFVGAYWQINGFDVIPTFSISNVDSLDFCLMGLPARSVLGVSAEGFMSSPGKIELFNILVKEVESKLDPIQIIIYGPEIDLTGVNTPIKYIPDYITTHFRNGNR